MSELARRALTGAVYVLLTIGAAYSGPFTTTLLFLPVGLVAAAELHRLGPHGTASERPVHLVLAGIIYLAVASGAMLAGWSFRAALALALLVILVRVTDLIVRGVDEPFVRIAGILFMVAYTAVPLGLLAHLAAKGPMIMLGVFVLVWTNDTGAYLAGRTLGRRKLLPSVSPNKTVEGLLGGLLLTVLVGWGLSGAWPSFSTSDRCALALLISLSSTLGDLLESALKRARGVKDSGTLLPGHGGVLDRMDGLLIAIPVYVLFLAFGPG